MIGSSVAIVVLLGVIAFLLMNGGEDDAPQQAENTAPLTSDQSSIDTRRAVPPRDMAARDAGAREGAGARDIAARESAAIRDTSGGSVPGAEIPATTPGMPSTPAIGLSDSDLADLAPNAPPEVRAMIMDSLRGNTTEADGEMGADGIEAGSVANDVAQATGRSRRRNPFGQSSTEWRGDTIHFLDQEGLTFGPPGCPLIVIGKNVWDWQSTEIVQTLEGDYEGDGLTSLSTNGTYFAASDMRPYQDGGAVFVWDTSTGERIFSLPGQPDVELAAIHVSDERLFVFSAGEHQFQVYDLASGDVLRPLELSDSARVREGQSALTYDGQYLAAADHDRMVVLNTSSGRTAATMARPSLMQNKGISLIIRDGKTMQAGSAALDPIFVYSGLKSVAFSPDSEELAALSTHPDPRLMCWSNRGKLIFDEPVYTSSRFLGQDNLTWFPNRSAWLIDGDVFHRESARVVLSVPRPFSGETRMHVLDNDHIVGTLADNKEELSVMTVPWELIQKSIDQIETGGPAILSPDKPVSVEIKLGQVRGGTDVLQSIQTAIAQRLARDGMQVAPNQSTVFRLRFAEEPGDILPIFERQSPFDFFGHDTGRTMQQVNGTLVVELYTAGQQQPLWRDTIRSQSSRLFTEAITDENIRKSMLRSMIFSIADLDFPYYLPESDEFVGLPIVVR